MTLLDQARGFYDKHRRAVLAGGAAAVAGAAVVLRRRAAPSDGTATVTPTGAAISGYAPQPSSVDTTAYDGYDQLQNEVDQITAAIASLGSQVPVPTGTQPAPTPAPTPSAAPAPTPAPAAPPPTAGADVFTQVGPSGQLPPVNPPSGLADWLRSKGFKVSTTPHSQVGWSQWSSNLSIYAPRPPGAPDPLANYRDVLSSLTNPYLSLSAKQAAAKAVGYNGPIT